MDEKKKIDIKVEKFKNIIDNHERIEDESLDKFISFNGFYTKDTSKNVDNRKRDTSEITEEEKNAFFDEMISLFIDYSYDKYLMSKDTERNHSNIVDRPKFFDIISEGPSKYVSLDIGLETEGEEESKEKIHQKKYYLPCMADIKRSGELGGAIEMSKDAKEIISSIIQLNESTQIQKASVISASNNGRITLLKKDLVTSHKTSGLDTFSV